MYSVAFDGQLCFAGADPHTGNLGVSALCYSALGQLGKRLRGGNWILFDYGRGIRQCRLHLSSGTVSYEACGLYDTRRLYRPESLGRARVARRFGAWLSPGFRRLQHAVAMLDISGGDSFTDLYGARRFREISGIKEIALAAGAQLVLLPQTYGPFERADSRAVASRIVRAARAAWARDANSFGHLRDLLGPDFDPLRHHCGVDVAFLLPTADGARLKPEQSTSFVGINISGLIWNNPQVAKSRYRLKADYRAAMVAIVGKLAMETPVVLVPHVLAAPCHYESDRGACEELVRILPVQMSRRVTICPDPADPCEAKGFISGCEWFLGTRMHATIASLSTGVPSSSISYSDKTLGVFETCGQGEHVHDPRILGTDELVERVICSFRNRQLARSSLSLHLPNVLALAQKQMDEIAASVQQISALREERQSR